MLKHGCCFLKGSVFIISTIISSPCCCSSKHLCRLDFESTKNNLRAYSSKCMSICGVYSSLFFQILGQTCSKNKLGLIHSFNHTNIIYLTGSLDHSLVDVLVLPSKCQTDNFKCPSLVLSFGTTFFSL